MCYRLLAGGPDFNVKFLVGSIKEPFAPAYMGCRRTIIDVILHFVFDFSRIWLMISDPSPACAILYFLTTVWMYFFDHGEYIGMYGMYHGPWSVFILARYSGLYDTSPLAATTVLQYLLLLLYIGCGLGKMGPWFISVFNQEWTLPPWARLLDLKPLLCKVTDKTETQHTHIGEMLCYVILSSVIFSHDS